jgi:transposase
VSLKKGRPAGRGGGTLGRQGGGDPPGRFACWPRALAPDDQVALEATRNALAIAAILRPFLGRVAPANPAAVRGELNAPKTDKVDARSLARLLATGFLAEVWAADPETAALRHQLARLRQLVKQRAREKNQVHVVLQRNVKGRPPASDLFGAKGREWLATQELPEHERAMVEACLRHIDFLDAEVGAVDRRVGERVLASPEMCRQMQLPGVGRNHGRDVDGGRRRRRALSGPPPGQLSRAQPQGPPVGLRARQARPHLQARPRRGAACL